MPIDMAGFEAGYAPSDGLSKRSSDSRELLRELLARRSAKWPVRPCQTQMARVPDLRPGDNPVRGHPGRRTVLLRPPLRLHPYREDRSELPVRPDRLLITPIGATSNSCSRPPAAFQLIELHSI